MALMNREESGDVRLIVSEILPHLPAAMGAWHFFIFCGNCHGSTHHLGLGLNSAAAEAWQHTQMAAHLLDRTSIIPHHTNI